MISSQSSDNVNLAQSQQLTSTISTSMSAKMNTSRVNKYSTNNSNAGTLSNLSYSNNKLSSSANQMELVYASNNNNNSSTQLKYNNQGSDENDDDYADNDEYDLDEHSSHMQTNEYQQHKQTPLIHHKNQSSNSQNQFNTSSNNSFANQLNQHVSYQNQNQSPQLLSQHQQQANNSLNKLLNLNSDDRLKYVEKLESEFDLLMKHKHQLDAQLTRLPLKASNTSMHTIRENVESELTLVEKKLDSVKLELRKLNILKTH